MHPKLKPKNLENAYHIWCISSKQKKPQIITEDLQPMQSFLSKYFDLPVSVFVDASEWSIAIFWDVRLFGLAKFFDKEFLVLFLQL